MCSSPGPPDRLVAAAAASLRRIGPDVGAHRVDETYILRAISSVGSSSARWTRTSCSFSVSGSIRTGAQPRVRPMLPAPEVRVSTPTRRATCVSRRGRRGRGGNPATGPVLPGSAAGAVPAPPCAVPAPPPSSPLRCPPARTPSAALRSGASTRYVESRPRGGGVGHGPPDEVGLAATSSARRAPAPPPSRPRARTRPASVAGRAARCGSRSPRPPPRAGPQARTARVPVGRPAGRLERGQRRLSTPRRTRITLRAIQPRAHDRQQRGEHRILDVRAGDPANPRRSLRGVARLRRDPGEGSRPRGSPIGGARPRARARFPGRPARPRDRAGRGAPRPGRASRR